MILVREFKRQRIKLFLVLIRIPAANTRHLALPRAREHPIHDAIEYFLTAIVNLGRSRVEPVWHFFRV